MGMMPRRERARLLLRGLVKLLAVVAVAGLFGAGLGIGLAQLSDDGEPPTPVAPATTATAQSTTRTTATAAAPTTTTSVPTTSTPRPASQDGEAQVRVTVGIAVLHPASTPSGRRRNRARLGVRVTAQNTGAERLVLPRPSLLAARQRVRTNPAADAAGSRLGPIPAGETQQATLQFETAGVVTEQLSNQQQARVLVGDRSYAITVTLGPPVSRRTPSDTAAP